MPHSLTIVALYLSLIAVSGFGVQPACRPGSVNLRTPYCRSPSFGIKRSSAIKRVAQGSVLGFRMQEDQINYFLDGEVSRSEVPRETLGKVEEVR